MNPSIYKPRYVVLNIKAPETVTEALINEVKELLKTRTMGALCKVQMTDTEKKRNMSRSFNWSKKEGR